MVKTAKGDTLSMVLASAKAGGGDLRSDLLSLMKGADAESNKRGLEFTLSYYGLLKGEAKTLEGVGRDMANGLTRERVRQIIDSTLASLLVLEGGADQKPFAKARVRFEASLERMKSRFVRFDDLIKDKYFSSFEGNRRGLAAMLNDAGIKQVVYRGEQYLYPAKLKRKDAIGIIQDENKRARRANTLDKMESMAKTVTYVPTETRKKLLAEAKKRKTALNRLYEKILLAFMKSKPYESSDDFERTKSWKARQGRADWEQVGIYIAKPVFVMVKKEAAEVSKAGVSNMSYICHAFSWFCASPDSVS